MNKTKKILRSLVVVGVVGAVATAGAFSAFSAQTDNPNNQITAGTVDVQDNDAGGALYSIGNAKPNDPKENCIEVTYTNDGGIAHTACVGFGMDPIEGLYIVALASVFSMIPSGPAYAGTQDAAAILGIKALGGTGAQAVAYIVMLRFIIVVPITLVGLVLLAARYGGLGRLRMARAEASG